MASLMQMYAPAWRVKDEYEPSTAARILEAVVKSLHPDAQLVITQSTDELEFRAFSTRGFLGQDIMVRLACMSYGSCFITATDALIHNLMASRQEGRRAITACRRLRSEDHEPVTAPGREMKQGLLSPTALWPPR